MKKIFIISMLFNWFQPKMVGQNSDWANLAKYKTANQKVSAPNGTLVVFLGDSITEGWVNADSTFFANDRYVGRGISGQTSPQLLVRFRQDVLDLKPKTVIISIGTNDIAENTGLYSEDFTFGNIVSMCELAKSNGITPLLTSVFPASNFYWNLKIENVPQKIKALNTRLFAYAKSQHMTYIDYHSALTNAAGGMDLDLAYDGVHPTLKGYKIMEALVEEVLVKH
jgi:lysophospholipase L1-like esterase